MNFRHFISRHIAILAVGGTVFIWGMSGTYFYFLSSVPAPEILAHRIVWSALVLGVFLLARGRFDRVPQLLVNPRTRCVLFLTSLLISANWGLFIWAVGHGLALECSLAYFITPLLVVFLSYIFLGERLSPRGKLAIAILCAGVGYRIVAEGSVSWVPFAISSTFAG